jgi:metal-sulfur cluster biosynthetic enzyme
LAYEFVATQRAKGGINRKYSLNNTSAWEMAMTVRVAPGQLADVEPRHAGLTRNCARVSIDPDLVPVLRSVYDPTIRMNIVDLGLVHRAKWMADGIKVVMSTVTPSCVMADVLTDDVRAALRRSFPDAAVVEVEVT